jgi:MFS family permease
MIPSTYKRILSTPGVRAPLVGAIIGRLPFAAEAFATLLLVKSATGSFADAGLVNAAYTLAVAATMPIQGRIIDRIGQTPVFVATATVNAIALIVLVALAQNGSALGPMIAAAAVAGAAVPPIGTSIRTLWARLIPDPELRQSAFALDAIALELAFICGPLLIALTIAIASPAAAVLVCVGLELLGSLVFATSRASREWRGGSHDLGLIGPLRAPGVRTLMGAACGVGLTVGAIELGITAFAADHGHRAVAGALIAVQAGGSFAGGLWYGGRTWSGPASHRLLVLGGILTLTVVPLAAAPSLASAFPLMLISGVALAPTTAVIYLMLDFMAPEGTAAEATGWVLLAVLIGASAGNAAAGLAVNGSGPHAGLAVALAGASLTTLVAWLGRRSMLEPARREQPFARVHSM